MVKCIRNNTPLAFICSDCKSVHGSKLYNVNTRNWINFVPSKISRAFFSYSPSYWTANAKYLHNFCNFWRWSAAPQFYIIRLMWWLTNTIQLTSCLRISSEHTSSSSCSSCWRVFSRADHITFRFSCKICCFFFFLSETVKFSFQVREGASKKALIFSNLTYHAH